MPRCAIHYVPQLQAQQPCLYGATSTELAPMVVMKTEQPFWCRHAQIFSHIEAVIKLGEPQKASPIITKCFWCDGLDKHDPFPGNQLIWEVGGQLVEVIQAIWG